MADQQQQQQQQQQQTQLNPVESTPSASEYDDSSETVGEHDPYRQRRSSLQHHHHHEPPHGRHSIEHVLQDQDQTELRRIATALSQHQHHQPDTLDAALNPESADFDVTKWVRNFMSQLNEQGHMASRLGVVWRDLDVYGSGEAVRVQETVTGVVAALGRVGGMVRKRERKKILHGFNGVLRSGELLVVLGRPGSGCSTFLKTVCGEMEGLVLGKRATVRYNGVGMGEMRREFKGEVVYNQETLEFAAAMRTPSNRISGMSRAEYHRYIARVVMAVFGLSHVYHTKVGSDYVRGVSGGERKRVSIAEMMVAGSPLCAWDNSTRGLDSASALRFVQALRVSSDVGTHAHAVAIYQASQAIYDIFDKATVLYEGRQIYFGPAHAAKAFFERQGWLCPPRQTTGDFLTSITNPSERVARPGMEHKVPRTPEEFERYWLASPEFAALQRDMALYEEEFAPGEKREASLAALRDRKRHRQAKGVRAGSPYMISIPAQIRHNTKRAYQRVWNDLAGTAVHLFTQLVLALIIGSIFYGNPDATAGFDGKGSILFMAILLNALTAISEIDNLYAQRPIVEKHASYAFYHPFTEAAAGVVADIPVKFVAATVFNLIVYFLSGLRREPGNFFLYFLVSYVATFTMTAVFRTLAAVTKTVSQAMALAGVIVLVLIVYTGYIIPVPQMHPWFGWLRWLNPIYYGFEMLVANEFHGREFPCSQIVPPYSPPRGDAWICASAGAVPGRSTVSGDAYIEAMYGYSFSHVWRNFGILMGFLVGFMVIYFAAVELNSSTTSTAEALVFQRGKVPAHLDPKRAGKKGDEEENLDSEAGARTEAVLQTKLETSHKSEENAPVGGMEPHKDIFTWKDVVYDIQVKEGQRRLLDHVCGWVKPGTLTALMGASGAGKTTLLDVLARRTTVGVVTGDMLVNGCQVGADFQRQTGYVQQQDLHLDTATVRESLRFSALLRRPPSVPIAEKYAFVEEVIKILGMEEYADAVVGVPGSGLNVEQRKMLTIGVELVAKPKLLLFLDEPTSGLDSQSAWSICVLLRRLADAGQAVLCTIHQPNAVLFQQFDRLLFLAKGGRTVYFGDIGKNSQTLLGYFEKNGARRCGDDENPAEYMLEIVAQGVNDKGRDWHEVWKESEENGEVLAEIERICAQAGDGRSEERVESEEGGEPGEFAMPFHTQVWAVTKRIFEQYWRMPGYVLAKLLLGVMSGLFIGFSFFKPDGSQAGMRNVVFAVFMVTTIFTTLVQQIQPLFITQRSLYEVRERPSKTYSWKAFLVANIVVEMPYQILTGILTFACFYYPVVGVQSSARQGLVLLFTIQLFMYASAFAHMTIAALPDAQAAAGIVILLTMMSTIFSGVLQTRQAMPGFWTFMYYVSPFTYWIAGIVATLLHGRAVTCSPTESLTFNPPPGMTCAEYLAPLAGKAEGVLQNPFATEGCQYSCSPRPKYWDGQLEAPWQFHTAISSPSVNISKSVQHRHFKTFSMATNHQYPGAGLPLRFIRFPEDPEVGIDTYRFGSCKGMVGALSELLQVREVFMMILMDRLTEKPNWHEKVFNDEIVAKWRQEAVNMPEEDIYNEIVGPERHVPKPVRTRFMTEKVFDYCIEELRCKAEYFKETGLTFTLNSSRASASFSDDVNTVVKSDTLVDEELRRGFIAAFEKLRAEQGDNPDWHPGTDDMVQDLVHPSLYPFVYGKSNFFQQEVVGVEDAIDKWSGKGKPIEPHPIETSYLPDDDVMFHMNRNEVPEDYWSQRYQWLPANLAFQEDGTVRFTSYINNLHPKKHADTYRLIEKLIDIAIPAWESVCSVRAIIDGTNEDQQRLDYPPPIDHGEEDQYFEPFDPETLAAIEAKDGPYEAQWGMDPEYLMDDEVEAEMEDEEAKMERKRQRIKWRELRDPILMETKEWRPMKFTILQRLREKFKDTGLQVIVKMASIELTPEKPTFPAGGWHIEGMMNEHIVATALYYIDSENITDSHLSFRMATNPEQEELQGQVGQDLYELYERLCGTRLGSNKTETVQVYGSVATSQGRFLAFPNVFQHRVSSFRLTDPTKPGHRRFIALWLIDPTQRIISTANVPPQRFDWWCEAAFGVGASANPGEFPPDMFRLLLEEGGAAEAVKPSEGLLRSLKAKLPAELRDMIRSAGPVPPEGLMTAEEAREHRERLMGERSGFTKVQEEVEWAGMYSFCEH
ncbi:hypothetical protein VTJ49DRAFT_521 [Mycothermus thermophilus]|uniref:ABC transporter domain-containing protein n=1 Tax=Humicola insolens TaxID=85995 RepID=A0ABR3VF01_HUMIN